MEQVPTQQQHIHVLLLGQLQDFLKGSEGIISAVLLLLPHALGGVGVEVGGGGRAQHGKGGRGGGTKGERALA